MKKDDPDQDRDKSGFDPEIDDRCRVLILGSYPGKDSLKKRQYYGHEKNQFWRLIGDLIGKELIDLPYEERMKTLKDNHIGLWDVYLSVERKGSLDSAIKKPVLNDFSRLKEMCPELKIICFNGKKAGKHSSDLEKLGYDTITLLSSSPANAIKYEIKLSDWKRMEGYLMIGGVSK